jgi:ribosomal RNA methyltransferase Nop2
MKKQGIPEPLDESLVTRKRKDYPAAPVQEKKKRRTEARTKATVKAAAVNGGAKRAKGKVVKKEVPPPADDEISDDDNVLDGPLDGINITGLDALGSASEDDDEFMDSDTDVKRAGMWSDDESDTEVAEKLTQANIEGLSRKLDMQKAIEAAEAQAEMEEAAMQTNIAGDRPKILDDEEDDGRPISNLAPQDLQLLRTRLTDTIRILEDLKLAEPGRSRTEYRAQFLRDICAYYGYSEFLADKLMNLFPAKEAFAFFEANETQRPVVIRTNTVSFTTLLAVTIENAANKSNLVTNPPKGTCADSYQPRRPT